MSLTEQYEALKAAEERASKLRTEADTLQRVARQQVEAIDKEIRDLGVDPDKIDQEIEALEAALAANMATLAAQITTETEAYEAIIAAARAAGLQA